MRSVYRYELVLAGPGWTCTSCGLKANSQWKEAIQKISLATQLATEETANIPGEIFSLNNNANLMCIVYIEYY